MAVTAAAASTSLGHHGRYESSSDPYYCNPYYSYKADTEPALPGDAPPPSYESIFGKLKTAKSESHGVVDFVLRLFGGLIAGVVGIVLIALLIGLMLVVPVAMAVIGFLHIDDCPSQRFIPLYLIVGGIGSLVYQLLSCTEEARSKVQKWTSNKTCENDATGAPAVAASPDTAIVSAETAEKGSASPNALTAGPTEHSAVCIPDNAAGDATATEPNSKELRASRRPMACFETLLCIFLFVWFICGNVWVYGLYSKGPVTADQCHPLVFTFAFWVITGTYIMIGTIIVFMCICGCVITTK